jgi:transposase
LSDDVMIAVDPHKAGNTAAVLDPVTTTVIKAARFANTMDGYAQLTAFAGRWAQRRWAAGGCFGAGRPLAQRLVADGEMVLDVPAKLAARVWVCWCGHGRKTGKQDAVSVGLAALDGAGVLPVAGDDALVSLRLLSDRRGELTAQRTQAVCRLHRLLAGLTPAECAASCRRTRPKRCSPAFARPMTWAACGSISPAATSPASALSMPGSTTSAPRSLPSPAACGTGLTGLFGVGPVIAGRLLAEVGDVARFATKDAFASDNGTAPLDVSCGDQIRHRLCRAGNRRINHALHMMAVTQIRCPGTPGHQYYERKRCEGKTPKQALRCLKRRLSDLVYYQLIAGRRGTIGTCGSPTAPPPTWSTSTSPATRLRRFWPFQWIQGGWQLALSALLIAATVWLVHRRAT